MFYTGAPQNTVRKEIDMELVKRAHDLISSNMLNVCYLKELYRQEEGSNIISLAYDIKNGDFKIRKTIRKW